MNTLTIVALGLIFLGGIGAILLTIGQSISSSQDKSDIINTTKSENTNLKKDIAELKRERDELSEALAKRDLILQERNDTIIELNHKLSEKSEYIQNYLTGGTGYPVIDIENFATDNFNELAGMFKVRLVSKFPIYNLDITIFDYDQLVNSFRQATYTKNPVITMADFNNAKILTYKLDELSPIQKRFLNKKIKLKEARYLIQLQARNNVYIEKIASIVHKTILHFGYQVFTIDGKLVEQGFGDNASNEVQSQLIKKLNTITTADKFDLIE